MPYTRSLEGFKPPKRFDDVAFTSARIQESATQAGTYTTLETVGLDPVDSDPSDPLERDFTTNLATLASGWYRIEWVDDADAIFDSDPVSFFPPATEAIRTSLKRMTAADEDPELSDAEIDSLLERFAREDSDGFAPIDSDWTPTYALNAAAAEGWRWKAGRVAASTSSSNIEGDRDPDSFKYLNCIRQAENYAKRSVASVSTGNPSTLGLPLGHFS